LQESLLFERMALESLTASSSEGLGQLKRSNSPRDVLECPQTEISSIVTTMYFIMNYRLKHAIDEMKLVSSFEQGKVNPQAGV